MKISFQDYLKSVLPVDEQEDVLLCLENEFDSSDDELSAGEEAVASDDDDELDTTEPEQVDHRAVFECPSAFKALEKPASLLSSAEGIFKGLFILMLWEGDGWELGKVLKYAPRRVRHNYDILWSVVGIRGSKISLDQYADIDTLELQPVGSWAYVRKA
ncbi:hypothetical protein CYMTET_40765 [Cymbomonas tetramitiformis]|uniref:Uncharacterized protein n=1 Tax=Cymbomonas tetramitiformis TaxID=36881 RepID=A0AAE0C7G1_9CHLO|nr:hypothetical protein CYMTET_40765 [Cymbomonas tetramitiformis]